MNKFSLRVSELLNRNKINSLPVNLEKIVKSLGIQIKRSELEDNISGFLYLKNETPIICVNKGHSRPRKRFTIAHELGHFILNHHGDLFIDRARVLYRNTVSHDGIIKEEREANRFAAELLMPEELLVKELIENEIDIDNEFELKQLAYKCGVSIQALTIRLTNLGWS